MRERVVLIKPRERSHVLLSSHPSGAYVSLFVIFFYFLFRSRLLQCFLGDNRDLLGTLKTFLLNKFFFYCRRLLASFCTFLLWVLICRFWTMSRGKILFPTHPPFSLMPLISILFLFYPRDFAFIARDLCRSLAILRFGNDHSNDLIREEKIKLLYLPRKCQRIFIVSPMLNINK